MVKLKRNNNAASVTINNLTIYFSYETPIAFSSDGKLVVRENDWGATTGKHLNAINSEKRERIEGNIFEDLLEAEIKEIS